MNKRSFHSVILLSHSQHWDHKVQIDRDLELKLDSEERLMPPLHVVITIPEQLKPFPSVKGG